MPLAPVITREVAALPQRRDDVHKGDVGRIMVVGGCAGEVTMLGAPCLAANAALRSGAGLVQIVCPKEMQIAAATLVPCATTRSIPDSGKQLLAIAETWRTDIFAIGPGLGQSMTHQALSALLAGFKGSMVLDADGLNLLASTPPFELPDPQRIVITPHPGEARRLLKSRDQYHGYDPTPQGRQSMALALVEAFGFTVVLKGKGTIATDGERLYVNETGNAGMATGGAGDVLTGIIAALLGQKLVPLEAAILGVYLHGLAGDFAAEELGRASLTASDIIDFLPEAFREHDESDMG